MSFMLLRPLNVFTLISYLSSRSIVSGFKRQEMMRKRTGQTVEEEESVVCQMMMSPGFLNRKSVKV